MCYLGAGHKSLIVVVAPVWLRFVKRPPLQLSGVYFTFVKLVSCKIYCNDCIWPVQSGYVIQFSFSFVSTLICVTTANGNTILMELSSKYVTSLSCFI